ncbi:MAG: acetyltransferase [Kangiella sp.]|nr:MAG: acetyltransferase [Gammaproteobacteria bacterium]PHS19209.1 MAG: acetyltransferase [Kangiella sp.]
MSQVDFNRLILKGITSEGNKFRPSDWAERLCGNLCTFRNRRMYYSPLLRPAVIEGIKCVIVDAKLNVEHPAILQDVVHFAQKNDLVTEKENES